MQYSKQKIHWLVRKREPFGFVPRLYSTHILPDVNKTNTRKITEKIHTNLVFICQIIFEVLSFYL